MAAVAATTVFEIVEEAGPLFRAAERFGKLYATPSVSRFGYSTIPVRDFVLENEQNVLRAGETFSGIGGLALLGSSGYYLTHNNTPITELKKSYVNTSIIKNSANTSVKGKVHSIEPFEVRRSHTYTIIDKNYSSRRYFVNKSYINSLTMPRTQGKSKLSTRLKRLEARVSPEVKYREVAVSTSALGANTWITFNFLQGLVRGTANDSFQGNEIKVLKIEAEGAPLGGVQTTLTNQMVQVDIIKSKQAALPIGGNYKPTVGDFGAKYDRDAGATLKSWHLGTNRQTFKLVHKFKYPLRISINDAQTPVVNGLYLVLRNNGETALPTFAGNQITLRVYYVDP